MNFNNQNVEVLYGSKKNNTIKHLIIAAHQDDAEIMAYSAISKAYQNEKESVHVVILSDGAGSPRSNNYATYSDEMMKQTRYKEQKEAAILGDYSSLYLLKYASSKIKSQDVNFIEDIKKIVEFIQPDYIYIHNPFDKHPTHVACCLASIKAIKKTACKDKINTIYGCEVWRGFDWMVDSDKISLDTSLYKDELALPLLNKFDSQISGGKRYDLATIARWLANATFSSSHQVDEHNMVSYVINMNDVIFDKVSLEDFVELHIKHFKDEITNLISLYK